MLFMTTPALSDNPGPSIHLILATNMLPAMKAGS